MGLPSEIAGPLSKLPKRQRDRLEHEAFEAALKGLPERDRRNMERIIGGLAESDELPRVGRTSALELVAKGAIVETTRLSPS